MVTLIASNRAYDLIKLMTAWFVILWRFAATYVRAKHIRAEMLNSNSSYQLLISGQESESFVELAITVSPLSLTKSLTFKHLSDKELRHQTLLGPKALAHGQPTFELNESKVYAGNPRLHYGSGRLKIRKAVKLNNDYIKYKNFRTTLMLLYCTV